jgi:hypothetical protein
VATSLLTNSNIGLLDTVFSVLLHTKRAVSLAAASASARCAVQCHGQVCVTVPSVLKPWLLEY